MLTFIIGLFIGAAIGLLGSLFCLAADKYLDPSIQSLDLGPDQSKTALMPVSGSLLECDCLSAERTPGLDSESPRTIPLVY
jgi:hypothetical protein